MHLIKWSNCAEEKNFIKKTSARGSIFFEFYYFLYYFTEFYSQKAKTREINA